MENEEVERIETEAMVEIDEWLRTQKIEFPAMPSRVQKFNKFYMEKYVKRAIRLAFQAGYDAHKGEDCE